MTLRRRTIFGISITLGSLIVLVFFLSRMVILSSFARLEEQNATQNIQRAVSSLQDSLSSLQDATTGRAWWDDTYAFMGNANQAYVENNLDAGTLRAMKASAAIYLDINGDEFYSQSYDLRTGTPHDISPALLNTLTSQNPLSEVVDQPPALAGILALPDGPVMLGIAAILNDTRDLPERGALVLVRSLNEGEIQRMAQITRLALSFENYYDPRLPDDFRAARESLSTDNPTVVRPLNDQSVASYALLNDIYGSPALILQASMPRTIYHQGQATASYLVLIVLILGVSFSLLVVLLLERTILARLMNLTREVRTIGTSGDLSARVSVAGKDELSELSTALNDTLAALQQSQSNLQQARNRLERSARLAAAGELAAGIAHQINNPLTAVVVETHLMLKQEDLSDDQEDSLNVIKHAAQRAGNVVQQLLDLTRTMPYDMQQLDVNDTVAGAVALTRRQVESHVKGFSMTLAPDLPPILGSRPHLEDIAWINLLLNARDAVKDKNGGAISLITRLNKALNMIEVVIEDNGQGIPAQDIANIFEPFFTTKADGTGLGLSVCNDVIEQHGGEILVESEQGVGTTFTVRLPALDNEQHPEETAAYDDHPGS